MHDHLNQTAMVIGGILSGVIGFLFDVSGASLWTAAFGACLAVAIKPPLQMWHAAAIILAGAVASGLLVPLLIPSLDGYPEKSLTFVVALVVIGGRNLMPQGLEDVTKAVFERIVQLISNWGPKK